MAHLFNLQGNLEKLETPNDTFSIEEIRNIMDGWFVPDKIGPLWIIFNEELMANKSQDQYNEAASLFFMRELYGPVMVTSSHELSNRSEIEDSYDKKFNGSEIEAGFLKLYNQFQTLKKLIYNIPEDDSETQVSSELKNNFYFRPEKINIEIAKSPADYRTFLTSSYDFIVNSHTQNIQPMVMLEDTENIIKIETLNDQVKAIEQVIKILEEDEEYEKCATLSNIREEIVTQITENV